MLVFQSITISVTEKDKPNASWWTSHQTTLSYDSPIFISRTPSGLSCGSRQTLMIYTHPPTVGLAAAFLGGKAPFPTFYPDSDIYKDLSVIGH